jgi:hypothetical protein
VVPFPLHRFGGAGLDSWGAPIPTGALQRSRLLPRLGFVARHTQPLQVIHAPELFAHFCGDWHRRRPKRVFVIRVTLQRFFIAISAAPLKTLSNHQRTLMSQLGELVFLMAIPMPFVPAWRASPRIIPAQ